MRNILCSYLTEQLDLQAYKYPKSQLLPSHTHTNITQCLSDSQIIVAGSAEGLHSFRPWGNIGLPLTPFLQQVLLPLPSFPSLVLHLHEICLHAISQALFLLTSLVIYKALVLCAVLASSYPPQRMCSVDLFPILLTALASSFFTFLTTGTCAKKIFIGTKHDLKLAHKRSLLLLPLGSPTPSGNWGKPVQRVVCWEPPARTLPVISGIYL